MYNKTKQGTKKMTLANVLTSLQTIFDNVSLSIAILELVLVVIILILFNTFVLIFVRRKVVVIATTVFSIGFLLATIFLFTSLQILCIGGLVIVFVVSIFTNLAEFRKFFANKVGEKEKKSRNKKMGYLKRKRLEKISSKEEFYDTIKETVLYLSKNKIGAIMTFERNDDLSDFSFLKNGVVINCPVGMEILVTIFYEGTRLHDGAVIIKGNLIKSASVFFNPSTRPLNGKYGSRHRAALGISEICDAVTLVVSEETGRISIAYNGELDSYSSDTFLQAFINYMQEEDD